MALSVGSLAELLPKLPCKVVRSAELVRVIATVQSAKRVH